MSFGLFISRPCGLCCPEKQCGKCDDGVVYIPATPGLVAEEFHRAYQELAPEYGYETKGGSNVPWHEVPEMNRHLMVQTAERVLRKLRGIVGGHR